MVLEGTGQLASIVLAAGARRPDVAHARAPARRPAGGADADARHRLQARCRQRLNTPAERLLNLATPPAPGTSMWTSQARCGTSSGRRGRERRSTRGGDRDRVAGVKRLRAPCRLMTCRVTWRPAGRAPPPSFSSPRGPRAVGVPAAHHAVHFVLQKLWEGAFEALRTRASLARAARAACTLHGTATPALSALSLSRAASSAALRGAWRAARRACAPRRGPRWHATRASWRHRRNPQAIEGCSARARRRARAVAALRGRAAAGSVSRCAHMAGAPWAAAWASRVGWLRLGRRSATLPCRRRAPAPGVFPAALSVSACVAMGAHRPVVARRARRGDSSRRTACDAQQTLPLCLCHCARLTPR